MGHARAILGLEEEEQQVRVSRDVVARGLSVRETEAMVRRLSTPPETAARAAVAPDVHTRQAEEKLRFALGTRVRIVRKGIVRKGIAGRIEIDFASEDELQRLYELLTSR